MDIYRPSSIGEEPNAYLEFLRTRCMSAGIYRLSAGATDLQNPHTEEEIYLVISGQSRFRSGDRDVAISAGDLLFVPAHEPHRFYEITQDLSLLVFFAPPEGALRLSPSGDSGA